MKPIFDITDSGECQMLFDIVGVSCGQIAAVNFQELCF